jgi:hypothetical protein
VKILLHDYLNPTHAVLVSTEGLTAAPYITGSAVSAEDCGGPLLVRESPEEIAALLETE